MMGETGLRGRTGQQQILYGRVFRLENSYFLPDDRRAAMDVGSRNVAVLVCDVIGSTAALFCLNSRCILQVGSCTASSCLWGSRHLSPAFPLFTRTTITSRKRTATLCACAQRTARLPPIGYSTLLQWRV